MGSKLGDPGYVFVKSSEGVNQREPKAELGPLPDEGLSGQGHTAGFWKKSKRGQENPLACPLTTAASWSLTFCANGVTRTALTVPGQD